MDAAITVAGAAVDEPAQSRALHASARTLIALATQLQHTTPADPPAMLEALAAAVARFEREAAAAGCDERTVAAASYVLCVWVDEVVAGTPWGAGRSTLLQRFHGERDGSDKVLRLLSRLAEQPLEYRALLELFHACLSLGLQGALRTRADRAVLLETLRSRVHLALEQLDAPPALSPPWHSRGATGRARWWRHALAGLLVLGLLALGVYTASHLLLAARADAVFASLGQLVLASRAPDAPPRPSPAAATAAPVDRLASRLAADAAAGRLTVRDEAHRSVITLPAQLLYERGSTQLVAAQAALLDRVAAALAASDGKIVVTGYTDGADPRTARLPSPWHQSVEWAREVAQALNSRGLAAERVSAEGAADADVPADASVPRRRVEIVLFP